MLQSFAVYLQEKIGSKERVRLAPSFVRLFGPPGKSCLHILVSFDMLCTKHIFFRFLRISNSNIFQKIHAFNSHYKKKQEVSERVRSCRIATKIAIILLEEGKSYERINAT